MAFIATTSILTTIDKIIERANEVKVCQDHMKLVTTSLTRLQHRLNDSLTVLDETHSQKDLAEILKAIDEIITSCVENENLLDGMTYKDLESVLVRLQYQLAQYESSLTDDCEVRVQILSNALQDQRFCVTKSSEETLRQRLDVLEQQTKKNIIEKLRYLREKYPKTIESYLRTCIELHQWEFIPGLTSDIVAKVANFFYEISNREQMLLENEWRSSKFPIKRTFIRFKADKLTPFERNELRRLLPEDEDNMVQDVHSRREKFRKMWERLISTPYTKSVVEKGHCSQEDDINEEQFIRNKRWSIILGDPGSGKTIFVRWLVYHLAQTLLLNEQHSTNYGPLRIPILICISEFAKVLKEKPSLTLFDYIGKHKWMGKPIIDDSLISLDDLSCALQDYIQQGQALIIFDGFDEISTSDQRSKIINIIENFVDTYVQIPIDYSSFDNIYLSKLLDDPSRSGGNQLIITSRIVNYDTIALTGKFARYTIQSMDKKTIIDFVDYWFSRVHQRIIDILNLQLVNKAEKHSEALRKELDTTKDAAFFEMASNLGLLSSICTICFSQLEGSPLPAGRFFQYESIVKAKLNLTLSKLENIDISQVIRILTDITSCIHQNSTSNLISNNQIKDICVQTIKMSKNNASIIADDIQRFDKQISEMTQIIRDNIGILVLRDESHYGFLHLAFQQYFTCLKLLEADTSKKQKFITDGFSRDKKIQLISQLLCSHMSAQRFRVPIAFALGKISSSWSQGDFDDLCYEFIQAQHEYDSFLPLGSYILINCVDDFVNYPSNEILFNVLNRLIIAAGQHEWSIVCPFLLDQIINALRKFRKDTVSLWIIEFLSEHSRHNIQTITVFCQLLEGKPHEFENIQWLDQTSCSILQSLLILDNENNGFAIDRLLVKIAFSNHQLLSSNSTTFKSFLTDKQIEINSIPVLLFPLIIALYGGLTRDGQSIVFNPSHIHRESSILTPILIRFLSANDRDKQDQNFKKLQQECLKSFVMRMENHDESLEAVDLCIATICLYNIEYIYNNLDIISNSFLRICMNRLKYISMILRQFYFTTDENDLSMEKETTKFISISINKFQFVEAARFYFLDMLNSLRSSVARLRSSSTSILLEGLSEPDKRVTLCLPNSLRNENQFLNGLLITDVQFYSNQKSCSLIHHFTKLFWPLEHSDEFGTPYRMSIALNTIPEYLLFRNDEDILTLLTFVPSHLQNLYIRLLKKKFIIINPKDSIVNSKQHLYFGHILTECLIFLSNASCKRLSILGALINLLPWLRMQQLENFGSSLLWTLAIDDSILLDIYEKKRKRPTNYETGQYMDKDTDFFKGCHLKDEKRKTIIQTNIEQEYQRLQNASINNDLKNIKLYSASISLAHICHWTDDEKKLFLLEQCINGAMSIQNQLARLDALCLIALYSYSDYDRIKIDRDRSLKMEIERQFNEIYPNLPLLLQTAIFIRCLPLLLHSQVIDDCLQNLISKFNDIDQRDRQAVVEALLPYMELNCTFSSITNRFSYCLQDQNRNIHNKSSALKRYFDISTHENLLFSLSISNLYLMELANDFHAIFQVDNRQFSINESIETKLFQAGNNILKEEQVLTITNILSFVLLTNQYNQYEKVWIILNNALHRMTWVEFKACRLLESWLKWRDSNEFSCFAYHAALLLINSDIWSVEATEILCDILSGDNDRFRHRAEIICRSLYEHDVRTSSKLGIDVILTLIKKKIYYQLNSTSAGLTLNRLIRNITLDIQSHLEILLWLERYRIHALINKEYSFNNLSSSKNSYITSFFSTDIELNTCSYINSFRLSNDLVIYLCDMIESNFILFLSINEDTTSDEVSESHNRFIVSILLTLYKLLNNTNQTRQAGITALMKLFEKSNNNQICQAIACLLGYVCNEKTYKYLFNKIVWIVNKTCYGTSNYSNDVLCALISSYFYCVSISKIKFDQDDLNLFSTLLKHDSQDIVKAVRVGLARVLEDSLSLIRYLDCDYIQCYHALIGSTASWYVDEIQQNSENNVAKFIEEHPTLLPIFMIELYDSIRHFSIKILQIGFNNYDLAYGYPTYVKIACLIAVRMPKVFCNFINDWPERDNFKRALFYTSKQNHFPQRAACLTILSLLGELTIDLCQMFIEAVHDDPYIQNNCYKSIRFIHSVKDEKVVLNLLLSYLKSKSMNVRYVTAKILLHLSQSSLIPFQQVQTMLNDLMLDLSSNEDLWLIKEKDGFSLECQYYYAGPLKHVIYTLLVQHITEHKSDNIRRNQINDIDLDFIESEKASRFASYIYEKKSEDIPE
ncbi:unnamed protein product [Rotaria sordida]|uniref:NACHT domain-containing protein n=1 Tax=Rotaria sordida TaxID=392033 RepID=A0A814XEV1_9BILA|nr:unnamed protein product [Rotaria sordida]